MNMNPLALIEKLIVEHGSAAILRQHLEFFRDQMIARDKDITELRSEIGNLTAEVKRLRDLNDQRKQALTERQLEIDRLTGQIDETREKRHGRDPQQVAILQMLEHDRGTSIMEIAKAQAISDKAAMFHVLELESAGFVESTNYSHDPDWNNGVKRLDSTWRVRKAGMRYLADNELL